MIQADTLPDQTLAKIADQIRSHIVKLHVDEPSLAQAQSVALAETFSIWTIRKGFANLERTAEALFEPIGYWHQLVFDGRAAAYARSTVSPEGALDLTGLGISPLVQKIDAAIDWLDTNVTRSYSVRMVIIPFAHLHCFWLKRDPDQFLPIDPLELEEPLQLRAGELVGIDAFVAAITRSLQR